MKEYSIVIPAYNEGDKITSTLTQVASFMNNFSSEYEIIVVDDGSTDSTAAIVDEYLKTTPNITLVRNLHKGKGVALYAGVMKAIGEYIYLCDADLSTPVSELKKMAVWAKENDFDIVIGSREGIGAQRVDEPFYRHLMGRGFNFLVQLLALPGIKDSQCGYKLFKSKVAKEVFQKLIVYGPKNETLKVPYLGAFDVEVLYIAKKLGYKIKEVPVFWKYVKTTRLRAIPDSIKMLRDVVKVRILDFKGRYN